MSRDLSEKETRTPEQCEQRRQTMIARLADTSMDRKEAVVSSQSELRKQRAVEKRNAHQPNQPLGAFMLSKTERVP